MVNHVSLTPQIIKIYLKLPLSVRKWPELSQQLSQRELVTALAKVHWLDAKLKEFDDAAKQYDDTYKNNADKIPTDAAINTAAAARIEKIAKEVLQRNVNLERHPNFDQNHNCCLPTEKLVSGLLSVIITERDNRVIDQHNTAVETADELRKEIQDQRNKYESIITFAAEK